MAIGELRVVVFVGGVGGAKLALGLMHILPPQHLTIVANTGDDMWHYGLRICPDIDTLLYTLSGRVDPVNGWGLQGDSTTTLDALKNLGDEAWFRLGDKDLATHLVRTAKLREGATLTQVTANLAHAMGIKVRVLPMSNTFVETKVTTLEHGTLGFQTYFVKHRWQPTVTQLHYEGAIDAHITPEVSEALSQADVILFAPSNPMLSIQPILSVQGMTDTVTACAVPRVAVSPIVGGQAIKGPAAKLMGELGLEVSPSAVARFYKNIINGFVYDVRDTLDNLGTLHTQAFDTMMHTTDDKKRLAQDILQWVMTWEKQS